MRRAVIAILVAVLLAAVALRLRGEDDGAARTPPVTVGFVANTLGFGEDVERAQGLVAQTGVRWIREELHWREVEPQRGAREWGAFDRVMGAAARRGMTVLPLLNDAPDWAGDGADALPADAEAFGTFAAAVVGRYGPGGAFWHEHPELRATLAPRWFELWNEPYYATPTGAEVTAGRYAALADAGMRAGRAANPDARFLVALDTSYDSDPPAPERWLAQVEAAAPGLVERADGVAVHPYAQTPALVLDKLHRLRAALDEREVERPLWITELGWSTCAPAEDARCLSEEQQAASLDDALSRIGALPRAEVPAVFVYSLHDIPGPPPPYEDHFGVLRLDGSRKPAWQVVRAHARRR